MTLPEKKDTYLSPMHCYKNNKEGAAKTASSSYLFIDIGYNL